MDQLCGCREEVYSGWLCVCSEWASGRGSPNISQESSSLECASVFTRLFTRCLRQTSGIPPVHWSVSTYTPLVYFEIFIAQKLRHSNECSFEKKKKWAIGISLQMNRSSDFVERFSRISFSPVRNIKVAPSWVLIHKEHYTVTGNVQDLTTSLWVNGAPSSSSERRFKATAIQTTLHPFLKKKQQIFHMFCTSLRDDEGPVGLDPSASACALHLVTLWSSC